MHIPDGVLNVYTIAGTSLLTAGALRQSIKEAQQQLEDRQVPLLGVMGAFIFAAQMVNFKIGTGTSGHFLGAALTGIMLGPWSAGLVLTTVLIIQCLFFADGGIAALGANALNMAVIAPHVASFLYRRITRIITGELGQSIGVFIAAFTAVLSTALAVAVELALSKQGSLAVLVPPILGWHTLIGIGEGLITATVITFVRRLGFSTWDYKGGDGSEEETA